MMTFSIITLSITITYHEHITTLRTVMLSVINKPIMLSVVMFSIIMLGVLVPHLTLDRSTYSSYKPELKL